MLNIQTKVIQMKQMKSSYYTPSIEEFHVRFEFEEKSSGLWTKQKYNKYSPILTSSIHDKYGVMYDTVQDYINLNVVRVKYLDKEDIESLGFKEYYNDSERNVWFQLNEFSLNLAEYTDFNIGIIDHSDFTLFRGTIKNKSELKVLLRQLNIIKL